MGQPGVPRLPVGSTLFSLQYAPHSWGSPTAPEKGFLHLTKAQPQLLVPVLLRVDPRPVPICLWDYESSSKKWKNGLMVSELSRCPENILEKRRSTAVCPCVQAHLHTCTGFWKPEEDIRLPCLWFLFFTVQHWARSSH